MENKIMLSGYTPEGLRALLKKHSISRETLADALDISLRAVHRWCMAPESKEHRNMSLTDWRDIRWWLERPRKFENVHGQDSAYFEIEITWELSGFRELRGAKERLDKLREQRPYERASETRQAFLAAADERVIVLIAALKFCQGGELGVLREEYVVRTGDVLRVRVPEMATTKTNPKK